MSNIIKRPVGYAKVQTRAITQAPTARYDESPAPSPDDTDNPATIIARIILQLVLVIVIAGVTHSRRQAPHTPAITLPDWVVTHDDASVHPYGPQPRDRGGPLDQYMLRVFIANLRRERVEIAGTCISACTLLLGARDVCIRRDAMLWFHAAFNPTTRQVDAGATRKMAHYWGPTIATWARSVGATDSLAFTRRRALSGEEAIRLGVPECR